MSKEVSAEEYFARYKGQPAIIFGNGPSLKLLESHKDWINHRFVTIGMNQSWKFMPADYHCIMFHKDQLEELKQWDVSNTHLWLFKDYCEMFVRDVNYAKVTYVPSVADPQSELHQYNQFGMVSSHLDDASFADMTGHFALEVALWMRCNPIYLIGYDLYGKHFCKDNHGRVEEEWQDIQVEMWDMTAEQIHLDFKWASVYNLSPDSRISGFTKFTAEELEGWLDGRQN
jgi:hypothetical protein